LAAKIQYSTIPGLLLAHFPVGKFQNLTAFDIQNRNARTAQKLAYKLKIINSSLMLVPFFPVFFFFASWSCGHAPSFFATRVGGN